VLSTNVFDVLCAYLSRGVWYHGRMFRSFISLFVLVLVGVAGGVGVRVGIGPDAVPGRGYVLEQPVSREMSSLVAAIPTAPTVFDDTAGEDEEADAAVPIVPRAVVSDPDLREEEVVAEGAVLVPPLSVSSDAVEQGDTLVVTVRHPGASAPRVTFDGVEITLFSFSPGVWYGVWGFDVEAKPHVAKVRLWDGQQLLSEREVWVLRRVFSVTELVLSETQEEQGATPATAAASIAQGDQSKIYSTIRSPLPKRYFNGSFSYPLEGFPEVVGAFGNVRRSGETSIRHLGTDLDAARGDTVSAVQGGMVRVAEYLDNFGNTVIIDHGDSIFSLYLHLDTMGVREGDSVNRTTPIGTVGNTGAYSLDPHLHFSVKVGGSSVDPLRFLEVMESLN